MLTNDRNALDQDRLKEATADGAKFLKGLTDEEVDMIWQICITQIEIAGVEKALRMGAKDPKIVIAILECDTPVQTTKEGPVN